MTAPEHFHETDPNGLKTLERFAQADHFNRWLFNTIQPWCKGHVLEVGSGIGNISRYFLEHQFELTTSDLREEYRPILQNKFGGHPLLKGIELLDLTTPSVNSYYPALAGKFDTVVALNVVEHIENDALAVQNCRQLLAAQGHFVILVPAYQWLYNPFDVELGHYRRYTARSLRRLLEQQGLEVLHTGYFNAVGIAGWLMNGGLLRKRLIPRRQLLLFDRLVPLIRFVDTLTFHRLGLSVIAIARKTS